LKRDDCRMAPDRGGGALRRVPSALFQRRSIAAAACIGLGAVAVGVAAGRGGDRSSAQARPPAPTCAHATSYIDRPDAVPAELLPSGTALTSRMNLPRHQTLVTGVIPLEFRNAVAFYVSELPRRGYQLGGGDAEMGEAEALFLGATVHGKWKVNGIPNCPKAVLLSLLVTR
jgi:hypothetical protein